MAGLQGKDLGALIGQIGADIDQWEKAFDKMERDMLGMEKQADKAAKRMGEAFDRASQRLGRIGKMMTTRVTVPIIAAGGAALKMAGDFDSSMRKITGLVGVAADKVDAMRGQVLGLAGETARAPQELADALFFVTSAGLRGQEAMDVLDASAKAAAAGLGETATVADLVTSAVNAYGPEVLSAAEATDVLVGAVREGKAEAPALASSLGQVLPIASNLGVTFDQVGAAVAAMTRTGTDAATASIQLRQILASLLKPTSQAEDAMKEMGTSSAQLRKTLREEGLIAVLGFLAKQMETNEQAMAEVFPNIRALSGALDLMGASAETTEEIFDRMRDTTGLTEDAFEAAQGPAFKFEQVLAKLKVAATKLGIALFPVLEEMIEIITPLVDKLSTLNEHTLKMGIIIAGAAAAIGPALLVLSGMAKAVSALVVAVGALISPLGLAATALGGLWFVISGLELSDKVKLFYLWEQAILSVQLAFLKLARSVHTAVKTTIESLINSTPPGLLSNLFGFDMGEFTTDLVGLENGLDKLDSMINDKTGDLAQAVSNYDQIDWSSFGDITANALQNLQQTIIDGLTGILNNSQIQELLEKLNSLLSGGGGGGATVAAPEGGVPDVAGQLFGSIDQFKQRGMEIANTMSQMVGQVETDAVRFDEATGGMEKSALDMSSALQSAVSNAAVSFGESIGHMIASGAKGGNFFDMLLKLVADFAVQFGKLTIAMGSAALSLETIFANPVAAIAAGTALVAAGTALKGLISSGPGGSSSGASATAQGPVARTVSESGDGEVTFRIQGRDLVGVLQQETKGSRRSGREVNLRG